LFKLSRSGKFKFVSTKHNKQIFVTPLITDSHLHILGLGEKLSQPTLERKKLSEIKSIIEEIVSKRSNKIVLRGWTEEFANPDKDFLDSINREIPIMLVRRCGHFAVVNSKVFESIDFSDSSNYVDFEEGKIKESTIDKFYKTFGPFTDVKNNYETSKKYLKNKGYGFVHSDDLHGISKDNLPFVHDNEFFVYEKVAVKDYSELSKYYELGYFNEFKCVKIYLDGSLGARTALLLNKYNDSNTYGEKLWEDTELTAVVEFCENNGLHLAAHAIGDGAIEQILRVFEKVNPKLRHRIIHAIVLRSNQIERIKKHNLIVDIQPQFMESDKVFIEDRLGERVNDAFRFYDLYRSQVSLFISSDAPVEEPDWLRDIKRLKEIGIPYNYSLYQLTYGPEIIDNIDRQESMESNALIFQDDPFVEISQPKIYQTEN